MKSVGIRYDVAITSTRPSEPRKTTRHRQVALGARHAAGELLLAGAQVCAGCRSRSAMMSGSALSMLRMPPVATAPAPM